MTTNLALLGPGGIARNALAPALTHVPDARLWSVLSRDRGRAEAFAKEFGAASPDPVYTDLDALLDDPELHAVIIATPDKLHAEQGVRAAKAGKHVFIEKPMVTNRDEGRKLIEACRQAGVRLGVAYHLRWHAGHRELTRRVKAGELGELRHMRIQWTFKAKDDSNWRASPDVGRWWGLAGVGTHCVDLVRWMMVPQCGEVEEVRGLITRDVYKGPHDENAVVAVRFASGATAEIFTSVLVRSSPRFEIYGSENAAIADGTLGPHGKGEIRIGGTPLPFTPADPYEGEIADFVAAVREERKPEVPGEEGLRNVEVLLRAVGA